MVTREEFEKYIEEKEIGKVEAGETLKKLANERRNVDEDENRFAYLYPNDPMGIRITEAYVNAGIEGERVLFDDLGRPRAISASRRLTGREVKKLNNR